MSFTRAKVLLSLFTVRERKWREGGRGDRERIGRERERERERERREKERECIRSEYRKVLHDLQRSLKSHSMLIQRNNYVEHAEIYK